MKAPESPLGATHPPTYMVTAGRVGRTQTVFVNASWVLTDVGRNGLSGIVTSVEHQAGEAKAGTVLYRVNLQPVVVAAGDTPAFREMTTGTVGPDVVQLQRLLIGLGFFSGKATGIFDASFADAVKRWQRDSKSDETGSVKPGQVLFVPQLPVRLVVPADVKVGKELQGGEVVAQQIATAPTFVVPLLAEQQRFAVTGAEVAVQPKGSDLKWTGKVTSADPAANGSFELKIGGKEGGSVCGDRCDMIPVGSVTGLNGQIILVAPRDGPVVPIGAVLTSADGKAHVLMADGAERPVTVLASSDGLAVVEGVTVGEVIRVGGAVPPASR